MTRGAEHTETFEERLRATVADVAAARGITYAEALRLCIAVLEQMDPPPDPPPVAAALALQRQGGG